MAVPPNSDLGADGGRGEDRPPFWSWKAIYGLVLGALAVQVVVYAVLSWVMR